MTKLEKISELCSIVRRAKSYEPEALVVDILTEETIDDVFVMIPKFLNLIEASKNTYHGSHHIKDCAICMALEELEK